VVLVIHGIGNQRPMDMLRGFVNAVWVEDKSVQRPAGRDRAGLWSKPYRLDENFELRRLTTSENRERIGADFFEFYWQHLMSRIEIGHVVASARTLLLRKPGSLPKQLRLKRYVQLE
jgi:hypothetical protein